MCPGGFYAIDIKFPAVRLAMLTVSNGTIGADKRWCAGRCVGGVEKGGWAERW
jgi:hypothetical protein